MKSLDNFYKLRKDFMIIGLTGKIRSGADLFVDILTQPKLKDEQLKFIKEFQKIYPNISDSESRKLRRITDFFNAENNWVQFEVMDYRSVVLLFILNYCYDEDITTYLDNLSEWIIELGSYKDFEYPRFGSDKLHEISKGSKEYLRNEFKEEIKTALESLDVNFTESSLSSFLKKDSTNFFFTEAFKNLNDTIFKSLDSFSPYLRYKLIHVTAYILRRFGTINLNKIKKDNPISSNLNYIYTIADVINRLIKNNRKHNGSAHIIIDRLKNSYELMYFKEKYGGFYMVGTNSKNNVSYERIEEKYMSYECRTDLELNKKFIKELDDVEYKVDEFKAGLFEGFDVENCMQKVDYHTYLSKSYNLDISIDTYKNAADLIKNDHIPRTNEFYVYTPFLIQILKLIALIQQPGLIVPTYIERIMQTAHIAKLNSGCISRQVGAVVTDSHFSVKGIGWNEVPLGQIPCSLRDIRDLEDSNVSGFSNFEKGNTKHVYDDGESFKTKISRNYDRVSANLDEKLSGRPCSICFKTFHNEYEGVKNQVHTRSLHAEENAMLQITKYGGQGLENGNLFTTASPCELCSKKAFQLGIKNIFYIDEYPGISRDHILHGGKDLKKNPNLFQYQGAIGRGYQRLYKPFMSIKDETVLRSGIKPNKKD